MKNLITFSRLARICGVHRATVQEAARSGVLEPAELGGKIDLEHAVTQRYIIDHMAPKKLGRKPYGAHTLQPTEDGLAPAVGIFSGPRPDPDPTAAEDPGPGGGQPAPAAAANTAAAGPLTRAALAAWIANTDGKPRAYKLARDFGVSIQVARSFLEDFQAAAAPAGDGQAPEKQAQVVPHRGESVDKFLDMTLRDLRHSFGLPESMLTWLEVRRKAEDLRGREIKNNETIGTLIPREMVRLHIFGALEQLAQRLLTDTPQTLARRIYGLAKAGAEPMEAQTVAADIIGAQIRNAKQVIIDNLDRISRD